MSISRRNMLVGSGVALGLPALASLKSLEGNVYATNDGKPPKRMIFMNFGFGMSKEFYPDTTKGEQLLFSEKMAPLDTVRDEISFISNLTNVQASGTGAHWGCTTFLSSADTRRTPGRAFHNDISCDQIAAKHIGMKNRFPAMHLTAANGDTSGMGPGTSMAWDERGNPIPAMADPAVFYSQLFGDGGMTPQQRKQLLGRKRSALDIVRGDAKSVTSKISREDKQKVDEYFTLVRSIEKQLTREEQWLTVPKPEATTGEPKSGLTGTAEVLANIDLMVAALQTDSTRVITYRMPTRGFLSEFKAEFGAGVGAHPMTHYGAKTTNEYKALRWREEKLCTMFATLVQKLKSVREADGSTLLDNTMVIMGSGLRTGHGRRNVPILMAGGKAMGIRHGRHIVNQESKTPLANLWLSMLKHAGCPVERFADSTEALNLL